MVRRKPLKPQKGRLYRRNGVVYGGPLTHRDFTVLATFFGFDDANECAAFAAEQQLKQVGIDAPRT